MKRFFITWHTDWLKCILFCLFFFGGVRAAASKFNLPSLYLPVKAYQSAEVLQRGMVEIARGQTALSGQQASLLPGFQKVLIGKWRGSCWCPHPPIPPPFSLFFFWCGSLDRALLKRAASFDWGPVRNSESGCGGDHPRCQRCSKKLVRLSFFFCLLKWKCQQLKWAKVFEIRLRVNNSALISPADATVLSARCSCYLAANVLSSP